MTFIYIISYLISAALAVCVILFTLSIAYKYSLFDTVDERKIHKGRIPRLGGVAIYLSSLVTVTLVWFVARVTDHIDMSLFRTHDDDVAPVLCGATILFAFGLYDDLKGLRYRTKFLAQIAAGLLLCFSGTWLNHLYGLFGMNFELPMWAGYVLTIFAILLITNAINFIDGIDGLASGLCAICLITHAIVSLCCGEYWFALISIVMLGAVSAFMSFNIFGKQEKHKKLFMGDTGSLVLGFMLGYIGIALNSSQSVIDTGITPFVLVFSPLLVPCFDVVRVVFVRLYQHRSPFLADKSHVHHMLLEIFDQNQRKTLLVMLSLSVLMIVSSFFLSLHFNINLVFNCELILWILIMMIISRQLKIKRHKK